MSVAENEQEKTQESLLKFMAAKRLTTTDSNALTSFKTRRQLWINESKALIAAFDEGLISKKFYDRWIDEVLNPADRLLRDESVKMDLEEWEREGAPDSFKGWARQRFLNDVPDVEPEILESVLADY